MNNWWVSKKLLWPRFEPGLLWLQCRMLNTIRSRSSLLAVHWESWVNICRNDVGCLTFKYFYLHKTEKKACICKGAHIAYCVNCNWVFIDTPHILPLFRQQSSDYVPGQTHFTQPVLWKVKAVFVQARWLWLKVKRTANISECFSYHTHCTASLPRPAVRLPGRGGSVGGPGCIQVWDLFSCVCLFYFIFKVVNLSDCWHWNMYTHIFIYK